MDCFRFITRWEVDSELNAEQTRHVMSRHQLTGQNRSLIIAKNLVMCEGPDVWE
jgi:hypothetical protein